MEEKGQKPAYEKPCAYHLNDYKSGIGDCYGPGSGDTTFCSSGSSASGEGCMSSGNNATVNCDSLGNGF